MQLTWQKAAFQYKAIYVSTKEDETIQKDRDCRRLSGNQCQQQNFVPSKFLVKKQQQQQ